jgi:hypothetical protein
MNGNIYPSSSKRAAIAANDPAACIQYFYQTMINVVLGWDKKTQMPIIGGGLFDFCKGFFTESQGSGNLHAHWVQGCLS